MFVLSRKDREAIRINNNIRVVITRSGENNVRVGIEAPNGVHVEREEIWIRRQQFVAHKTNPEILPNIIAALVK